MRVKIGNPEAARAKRSTSKRCDIRSHTMAAGLCDSTNGSPELERTRESRHRMRGSSVHPHSERIPGAGDSDVPWSRMCKVAPLSVLPTCVGRCRRPHCCRYTRGPYWWRCDLQTLCSAKTFPFHQPSFPAFFAVLEQLEKPVCAAWLASWTADHGRSPPVPDFGTSTIDGEWASSTAPL